MDHNGTTHNVMRAGLGEQQERCDSHVAVHLQNSSTHAQRLCYIFYSCTPHKPPLLSPLCPVMLRKFLHFSTRLLEPVPGIHWTGEGSAYKPPTLSAMCHLQSPGMREEGRRTMTTGRRTPSRSPLLGGPTSTGDECISVGTTPWVAGASSLLQSSNSISTGNPKCRTAFFGATPGGPGGLSPTPLKEP